MKHHHEFNESSPAKRARVKSTNMTSNELLVTQPRPHVRIKKRKMYLGKRIKKRVRKVAAPPVMEIFNNESSTETDQSVSQPFPPHVASLPPIKIPEDIASPCTSGNKENSSNLSPSNSKHFIPVQIKEEFIPNENGEEIEVDDYHVSELPQGLPSESPPPKVGSRFLNNVFKIHIIPRRKSKRSNQFHPRVVFKSNTIPTTAENVKRRGKKNIGLTTTSVPKKKKNVKLTPAIIELALSMAQRAVDGQTRDDENTFAENQNSKEKEKSVLDVEDANMSTLSPVISEMAQSMADSMVKDVEAEGGQQVVNNKNTLEDEDTPMLSSAIVEMAIRMAESMLKAVENT